jgi:hypothetical protein
LIGTLLILVVLRRGVNIRHVVGAMLVITAAGRLPGRLRETIQAFVRARLGWLLILLGLVHGISNLGGGVLTSIIGSVYEDKASIRRHIAFGYGLMASIQIAVLFVTTSPKLEMTLWIALPLCAALSYLFVGTRMFRATGEAAYQWSLTALIGIFGILLFIPG